MNQRRLRPLLIGLLLWALVFGAYVRIPPVSKAGFPLNDVGLFYIMTADLQRAGYNPAH